MKFIFSLISLLVVGFGSAQIDGQNLQLQTETTSEAAPNLSQQSSLEIVIDQGSKSWSNRNAKGSAITLLSSAINGKRLAKMELFVKNVSKETPINIQLRVVGRNKDLTELYKIQSVEVFATTSQRKGWVSFDFSKENISFSDDVYAYMLVFNSLDESLEFAMVTTEKNQEAFNYMIPESEKVLDLIPVMKLLFL
ncbi:MAG: hypothetical protein RQ756_06575 [Flavobacteriaceae bacterium]|nr:hypothetical protein [Flavobacteriaceae bacterium]